MDLVVRKFRGLAGPKGIPPDVTQRLDAGLAKALEDPAYKASYTKNDLLPAFMGRQEATTFTKEFAGELDAVAAAAAASSNEAALDVDGPDLFLGVVALAVSVGYLYEAARIPASLLEDAVGARGVPTALGYAIVALGLILCVRGLVSGAPAALAAPTAATADDCRSHEGARSGNRHCC